METTQQVKERPILFKGEMIRAILSGAKTQTRRVVKLPIASSKYDEFKHAGGQYWHARTGQNGYASDGMLELIKCPYGQPGDRLWVRETAAWLPYDITITKPAKWVYRADGHMGEALAAKHVGGWKPSIFMPRAASRILLEIVSVRVERLVDISEVDAVAEGIQPYHFYPSNECERASVQPPKGDGEKMQLGWANYCPANGKPRYLSAPESFSSLWQSINGPESWAANTWVWVITFRRHCP